MISKIGLFTTENKFMQVVMSMNSQHQNVKHECDQINKSTDIESVYQIFHLIHHCHRNDFEIEKMRNLSS